MEMNENRMASMMSSVEANTICELDEAIDCKELSSL
jgi:hypothetical protein